MQVGDTGALDDTAAAQFAAAYDAIEEGNCMRPGVRVGGTSFSQSGLPWGLLCKREGAPAHAGTPQLLRQAAASSEGRKEKGIKKIKEKPKNIMQDTRQAVKRAVASADAWQGDLEEHRLSAGAGGKQKKARPDEP